MPIYEYQCETCNHQFEVKQKFSDQPIESCVKCGKGVRKLISSPGIMFKGTGWYVTDYSNKLKDPSLKTSNAESGETTKQKESSVSQETKTGNGSGDTTSSTTNKETKPSSSSSNTPASNPSKPSSTSSSNSSENG